MNCYGHSTTVPSCRINCAATRNRWSADDAGSSDRRADAAPTADLLVNLSARLPAGFDRFARIAEIIDADPERRRLGRERFKSYRDHKLPLETHQLDDTADV